MHSNECPFHDLMSLRKMRYTQLQNITLLPIDNSPTDVVAGTPMQLLLDYSTDNKAIIATICSV